MSMKLGRVKLMKVSLESEKGTAVPGATAIYVFDPAINPEDTFQQRLPARGKLGNAKGVIGERIGRCTFRTELRSDGTSDYDAGLAILLQGCGLKLTTKVLTPTSVISEQKTVTIDLYEDGLMKQLYGAMGNLNLAGEFGKQVFCEFDFVGVWAAPIDETLPSAAMDATVAPIRMASATLAIGAYTPKISNFSLNLNNNVIMREDVSKAAAVIHALITERDPLAGMDLEADTVTAHDAYGIWLAGTEAGLSAALTDGTAKITIEAPKLQYRQVTEGDRNGLLTHELNAQCNADTGDDELSITAATA